MPRQMTGPWVSMIDMPAQLTPEQEMMLLAQNEQDPNLIYPGSVPTAAPQRVAPPVQRSAPAASAVEPLSQSAYDDLVQRLNAKGIQSLALQGQGIKTLEGQRDALAAMPQQLDLSPISNLIDQWTGQDLTGAYKRPMSAQEKTQMLMGVESGIQKAREGMSGQEIELLKSQLGIESAREAALARAEDRKVSREAIAATKDAARGDRADKEIQRQRESFAKSDDTKVLKGTTKFAAALNKYEDVVRKYGVEPVGKGAAELNNAYSDMKVAFKEIEDLGALAGPDLGILASQVGGSEGVVDYLRTQARGGKEGVLAQISAAKQKANKYFHEYSDIVKSTYPDIASEQIKPYEKHFTATVRKSGNDVASQKPMSREEKIAKLKSLGR